MRHESPCTDVFRRAAAAPGDRSSFTAPRRKRAALFLSKVFCSGESKLCISFVHQGARVCRKSGGTRNPRCLKSSVKFPQSLLICGAASAAGAGGGWSTVFHQVQVESTSADKLHGETNFLLQQDFAPTHSTQTSVKCFADHVIPVLRWPANVPDLQGKKP